MKAVASSILAAFLLAPLPVTSADDNGELTFPGVIPRPKEYQEHGEPILLASNDTPVGIEWFAQARLQFCVWLALLNRYDFTPSGRAGRVSNEPNRQADQIHAAKITAVSVLVAAVFTHAEAILAAKSNTNR